MSDAVLRSFYSNCFRGNSESNELSLTDNIYCFYPQSGKHQYCHNYTMACLQKILILHIFTIIFMLPKLRVLKRRFMMFVVGDFTLWKAIKIFFQFNGLEDGRIDNFFTRHTLLLHWFTRRMTFTTNRSLREHQGSQARR